MFRSCCNVLLDISFQFNLAINDHPDVTSEVKNVMANGRLPSKESPMCVEISLKTSEVRSLYTAVSDIIVYCTKMLDTLSKKGVPKLHKSKLPLSLTSCLLK